MFAGLETGRRWRERKEWQRLAYLLHRTFQIR